MSQQQFVPPPPSSRWEGGGYHSESSKTTSDDKHLETAPIVSNPPQQQIQRIQATYNYNIYHKNNNTFPPPPPAPHIKKNDIPPPPPIPQQQIQTQTSNINNSNTSNTSSSHSSPQSQSQSLPIHSTNKLIQQLSTADSMVEISKANTCMEHTPQSQPSSYNIITDTQKLKPKEQGEMDDGIESMDIIDMDVDNININNINFNNMDMQHKYNNNIGIDIDEEQKNSHKIITTNNSINIIFGDRLIRSLYMNATLFFFCILSFPLWFGDVSGINIDNKTNNDVTNAYILAAFSMFITFMACGFGLIFGIFDIFHMEMPFKTMAKNVTVTLYFVGGFFYFVAGCQYAQFYNNLGKLINTDLSGFGGIWWTEMFYVSLVTIIAGIDFWKPWLNRMDHRIYIFFSIYIFCSLILMFSYLICSDKLNGNSGFIAIGISYLFGFVISVIFLLMCIASNIMTKEFVIKPKLDVIKPKFDLILSILLFIFMLFTVISYWATKRIRDAEKVYYAGFGLFMFSITILMTFDMKFSLYIAMFIVEDE